MAYCWIALLLILIDRRILMSSASKHCQNLSSSFLPLSLFHPLFFLTGEWNKRGLPGRCHTAPRANIICPSGNRSGAKERSMLWLTHVGLKVLVSSNRGFPTGTEETRLSEEQKQQQQQQQKQLSDNFYFVLLKCADDCMCNLETKFRESRTNSEICVQNIFKCHSQPVEHRDLFGVRSECSRSPSKNQNGCGRR